MRGLDENVLLEVRQEYFELLSLEWQFALRLEDFAEISLYFPKQFLRHFYEEFEQIRYYLLIEVEVYVAHTHIRVNATQHTEFDSGTGVAGKQLAKQLLHQLLFFSHLVLLTVLVSPSSEQVNVPCHVQVLDHQHIVYHELEKKVGSDVIRVRLFSPHFTQLLVHVFENGIVQFFGTLIKFLLQGSH